jgi:8-oxo-dGTP pyrophosphatase MutT (NUDIX family)
MATPTASAEGVEMTNPNETRPAPESEYTRNRWRKLPTNAQLQAKYREGIAMTATEQFLMTWRPRNDEFAVDAFSADFDAALADRDAQIAALRELLEEARADVSEVYCAALTGTKQKRIDYYKTFLGNIDAALSRAPSVAGAEVEK